MENILLYTVSQTPGIHFSFLLNSVMLGHLAPLLHLRGENSKWDVLDPDNPDQKVSWSCDLCPMINSPTHGRAKPVLTLNQSNFCLHECVPQEALLEAVDRLINSDKESNSEAEYSTSTKMCFLLKG